MFAAFYKGFVRSPGIIVFILILGGVFWILNESKAIDSGVTWFLRKSSKLEKYAVFRKVGINNIIITLVMLMFSFFGAIFGMSEETIAFVIIFVPLAISMGYDSIVGICMCFIGAGIGFAGCLLNPFTLGIAQEISGIPLFSGIEYRLVIWMVINVVGISYVLFYASGIRKRPSLSPVFMEDDCWRTQHNKAGEVMEQVAGKKTRITYFLILVISAVYAVLIPFSSIQSGHLSLRLPLLPIISVLIGVLEMARVPFHKWFKWAWPLILLLTIIGFLLLIPTVTLKLPGF